MFVEITNLTSIKINRNKIKEVIQKVIKKTRLPFSDLSIAFISDSEIKKLNKTYRKKNRVTDVLSFNYGDSGEIVICYNQARKQAKSSKHSIAKELTILLIHAVLHLKGYDHEKNEKQAKLMRKKEQEMLKYLQEN